MSRMCEELASWERALSPTTRWSLSVFFALLAMNLALDFGEKLGRALDYLMH